MWRTLLYVGLRKASFFVSSDTPGIEVDHKGEDLLFFNKVERVHSWGEAKG
jgi:hypothetical protein